MSPTFKFGKLDHKTPVQGLRYEAYNGKDANWDFRDIEMESLGFHTSVTIKNYMREPLYAVDGLRQEPKIYNSIYANDRFMLEDTADMVVIEIRQRDNERLRDGRLVVRQKRKVKITIPAYQLQTNTLYVEELGTYFTIEPRLSATRELIAKNMMMGDVSQVSVPESMVKPDPNTVFQKFESLIKNCINRIDKIQVRVGHRVDVTPSSVPDKIKNLRISVYDNWFSPFYSNKMIYDPSLKEDEFVVENIHFVSSEELISTFEILNQKENHAFFLDLQERETIHGTLHGLGIFADPLALSNYLYNHKSTEAFDELMHYVASKDGSPILKKEIDQLRQDLAAKGATISDYEQLLKVEREQVRNLKRTVSQLEGTLTEIRKNDEAMRSYEFVKQDMENEREKIALDRENLEFEKKELAAKERLAIQTKQVNIFKYFSDILKSSLGIIGMAVTLGGVIYKFWNKIKTYLP